MKPIVKITWLDACSASGWRTEPSPPTPNYSIGYLVYEEADYLEIACTYDPDSGCWNGSMSIPRDNIIYFEMLVTDEEKEVEIVFEAD